MKTTTELSKDSKSLLALDIAKSLGWKPKNREYDLPFYLIRPSDGAEIYLRIDEYSARGMVSISGSMPRAKDGRSPDIYEGNQPLQSPSIKVSISRGADAIAKAITSRLLPEFDRQLALVREKIQLIDQEAVNHYTTLREVSAALSLPVTFQRDNQPSFNLYTKIQELSTHVKVDGSNSVKIDLPYMTKEQALAVIKVLQTI